MSEYFASRMLRTTVDMVRHGLRDLRHPDLAPFYSGAAVPAGEVPDRQAAASSLRAAAGLPPLTPDEYLLQAGPPSAVFFLRFLEAVGLSVEFVDDVFDGAPSVATPELGLRTDLVKKRAAASSPAAVRALIRSRAAATAAPAKQLRTFTAPAVADADPYVRTKLTAMRAFVSGYLFQ